jgi:anti-sigma factor RsiW
MENETRDRYVDLRLSQTLKLHLVRHKAPARLRRQILASLDSRTGARWPRASTILEWLSEKVVPVSIGFATASTIGASALYFQARSDADEALELQLVSAQVRSLMPRQPTVEPTSAQEVSSWLSGRLEFAPPVGDMAQDGYSLDGGRLEYISGRVVAAVVYTRGDHVVNVLACPLRGKAIERTADREGFNLVGWTDSRLQYWAVSNESPEELARFAQSYRQATARR